MAAQPVYFRHSSLIAQLQDELDPLVIVHAELKCLWQAAQSLAVHHLVAFGPDHEEILM